MAVIVYNIGHDNILSRNRNIIRSIFGCVLSLVVGLTAANAATTNAAINAITNTETKAKPLCDKPIVEAEINPLFHRLAYKQLQLEFGDKKLSLYDEIHVPVSPDLYRIEAYAKFEKPGRKNLSTMRVVGWMSICQGTVIVRGNTWLADGTLAVNRYAVSDLPGRGLRLGRDSAEIKIIAFVDSRCPHCHRLIGYARELVKDGLIQIEIRQVAYLETLPEALRDTRLSETRLINEEKSSLSDNEYLDMLTGLSNEDVLNEKTNNYQIAANIIKTNTNTAKKILHVTTVPAMLVLGEKDQYRLTSFWEMNRLLQPDL